MADVIVDPKFTVFKLLAFFNLNTIASSELTTICVEPSTVIGDAAGGIIMSISKAEE